MIKVGITGAETPVAGELLRTLLHHPEVDIVSLVSPSFSGRNVSSCHYGFVGESLPPFSEKVDLNKTDILFIAGNDGVASEILSRQEEYPELRIVDLSDSRIENMEAFGMEYGLSEVNRKPLVRGAKTAAVPTQPAALALISLHPFASNAMLGNILKIKAELPSDIFRSLTREKTAREIAAVTAKTQNSFNGNVNVELIESHEPRAMRVAVEFDCKHSVDEIDEIFENIYDDHNFTYTSLSEVETEEVAGTQKCIVAFSKPTPDTIRLVAVGDARLRGGAGDAVHLLNLFFALDEKVGLNLKPDIYGVKDSSRPRQTSWFA